MPLTPEQRQRINWKRLCFACLLAFYLIFPILSRADDRDKTDDRPAMAVVPPVARALQSTPNEDAQVNGAQIMAQVLPRVQKEANGKKWPFRILPPGTVEQVYEVATGETPSTNRQPRFTSLKSLAEKIGCRYLLLIGVNELTSAHKQEFFGNRLRARANLTLFVYDHDSNDYVWNVTQIVQTNHPDAVIGNVGMQREQDGALHAALIKGLEPFAKGKRMKVERPSIQILITVQRLIADGKKVVLDMGRPQGVGVGDTFKSVESDCQIKIVEVLDNGSIAEVIAGTPHEKEVFKPQSDKTPSAKEN